jgi:hypothetical protein
MWCDFMWNFNTFFLVGNIGRLLMLAGIAMAMNSVTVVGNSILLGRYKQRFVTVISKEKRSTQTRISKKKIIPCSRLLDNGIYSNKNNIAE